MTWFAWRVQRLGVLVAVAAVAGIAIWLTVQGLHEQALWNCLLGRIRPAGAHLYCSAAWRAYNFTHWNPFFFWVLYAAPGLMGLLLGAPLVAREFEDKTTRVAWVQSVSRTRWLVTKLVLVAVIVAVLTAGAVGLAEWWTGAVRTGSIVLPDPFDVTGLVPISYGVFAFALGVALGSLVHRTGWAVFVGVPIFGLARALMRFDVRPHLAATAATASSTMSSLGWNQGWPLHAGYLPLGRLSPPAGTTWSSWYDVGHTCFLRSFVTIDANARAGIPGLDRLCLAAHRLHYVVQYQPNSHYWQLQWEEAGIFLFVTLLLALAAVFLVRRRDA